VALAWLGTTVLLRAIPIVPNLNIRLDWSVGWRAAAFAFGLTTVAGLIWGVVPAWTATRPQLASTLSRERAGTAPRLRARSAFVVVQVALSVLLVVCALLMTRSMRHAAAIDPGFRMDGLEVVGVDMRLGGPLEKHLQLAIAAQNLFDAAHAEFGHDPGPTVEVRRSVVVTVTWAP